MNYKIDKQTKNKIIENIKLESTPDKYYFAMVTLSCIIATYGLVSNSAAVIIGAMLIAPLMYPILKGALSLTTGNNELFKTAMWAELSGVLISISIAILLTLLLPVFSINSEILARSKPTLLDLVIAFASGLAGTIAICYRPSSAILPGVAIASALMPPLCVIGIGVAKQDYNIAGGAILLFLSNIIAINVAGILIFKLVGFGEKIFFDEETGKLRFFPKRLIYPISMLFLISIPLIFFMYKSIKNTKLQNLFSSNITDGISLLEPNSKLASLDFLQKDKTYIINASIRTSQKINPDEVRKIENKIEYQIGYPVQLNLEVRPVVRVSNKITEMTAKEPVEKKSEASVLTPVYPEDIIEKTVQEKLTILKDAVLKNYSYSYSNSTAAYDIQIKVNASNPLDETFKNSVQKLLENQLNRKVNLNITENIISSTPAINTNNAHQVKKK